MGLLHVIEPGMLTMVQDLGRPGLSAIGVPRGGAADALSLRIGNRLVGNPDGAPALEMTMVGGSFAFEDDAVIALTGGQTVAAIETTTPEGGGAGFQPSELLELSRLETCSTGVRRCKVEGESGRRNVPMSSPVAIRAGERLTTGPIVRGVRTYLCIRGGIAVPLVLGSASTHLGAGLGGVQGRALRRDDAIEFGDASAGPTRPELASGAARLIEQTLSQRLLLAVDGAHASEFDASMLCDFWSRSFIISTRSDRVGVRLVGRDGTGGQVRSCGAGFQPAPILQAGSLHHKNAMVSEGIMCGAVQVPSDGEPIVLMVDHPTTGGYPVIACVATVDLPVLGQLRPGESVRFERTTLAVARELFQQRERELNEQVPLP